MIEVSAGVISAPDGRILICRRGEGRNNAHLWEFPGGKREEGESAADCLVRELMEELSLPVTDVQEIHTSIHDDIRFTFLTARTDALPILTEHEDARFVTPRELLHYDFCPADIMTARKLALQQVRHIFWDLDGTLLDSYPSMVHAFMAGAEDFGILTKPERILTLMKENLRYCSEIIGAEHGVSSDRLLAAFRRHEQEELFEGLPPVKGISETLSALHAHGIRHYVATHRDLQCQDLLETAGLLKYFSGFVTQEDKFPRKPAPDMLFYLMQKHGLKPEECMMIGDRPLDTEAGLAAGVISILLDTENRFPGRKCHLRIQSVHELQQLIVDAD